MLLLYAKLYKMRQSVNIRQNYYFMAESVIYFTILNFLLCLCFIMFLLFCEIQSLIYIASREGANMLEQLKAAGAIASASALVVIALFSSSTAVFADNNNGNEGRFQPVWCKITGQGWKAQLSANSNGKDGRLTIDVEGYTKVNGQIVA